MTMRVVDGVYVADTARVIGDVRIGADVSIWYGAVIRGDVARVTIGAGTNIQDNAVVHVDTGVANVIGAGVTVAHGAIVHGVSIGDGTLVGMGAVVLGRTQIGRGCLIAAGAVVRQGMVVPDGMVVMGVPGRVVRETNDKEKEYLGWVGPHYIDVARKHVAGEDVSVKPWGSS